MNDEWCRCPICFEDFSLLHRPTTFICGHSTCIDHTIGSKRLRYCPICRHPLKQEDEHHVSYSLEEASRLFQLIKNTIDWSTIKLSSAPDSNIAQNTALEMIHRDEIYARQLQAELDRASPAVTRVLPVEARTTGLIALQPPSQPTDYLKGCHHRCELVSTRRCCSCSDRRPNRPGNGYEAYVDGRGIVNQVTRNEYYCPTCKKR